MTCKNCGAKVKNSLVFCNKCGADVVTGIIPSAHPIGTVINKQKRHRFIRNVAITAVVLIAVVIVFFFVYRQ